MLRTTLVFSMALALFIAFPAISTAQMHGGGHGGMMGGNHGSMMNGKNGSMMGSMHEMHDQCMAMDKDMQNMESHIDQMMRMNDLDQIKSELKKHKTDMKAMTQRMSEMKSTCKDMMSDMHKEGGMMGTDDSSPKSGHSHNH